MQFPDAFTIRAVSQDEFEDVQVPDAPQPPRAGANTVTTGAVVK
jgi:cytochrome c oxidase assembly factor 3